MTPSRTQRAFLRAPPLAARDQVGTQWQARAIAGAQPEQAR